MSRPIDPVKLKASAERLEWVLGQYLYSDDVRALSRDLAPLIEAAKAGRILVPIDESTPIPGSRNFADGIFIEYSEPSVDGAYADFITELEGGVTDIDLEIRAQIDAMRNSGWKTE